MLRTFCLMLGRLPVSKQWNRGHSLAKRSLSISLRQDSFKSYAITTPGEDLQLKTSDLQTTINSLSPDSILVQTKAAGICHSDLHLWQGYFKTGNTEDDLIKFANRPGMGYPIVPGHEVAGTVYVMGENAKARSSVNIGDRILVYPWAGCDNCTVCDAGDAHICPKESRELGFCADGGYSEYVTIPHYRYAFKIPEKMPYSLAAVLPCSALTAYGALKKCLPVVERVRTWKKDLFVVVLGLGGLGQWALRLVPHCLPAYSKIQLVGIDTNKEKLDSALKHGFIDGAFQYDTTKSVGTLSNSFLKQFEGNKPNVVLDFVNSTDTFHLIERLLHRAGLHLMMGLHGGYAGIKLPVATLGMSTIAGSYTGSLGDLAELISLVDSTSISPLEISHYRLEEVNRALYDLNQGQVRGRAVLTFDS